VPFIVAGAGLFFYTVFHGITHATDSLTQIVVPGSAELHLQRGLYTIFLEEESEVNGRIYSTVQSVDGLGCRVISAENGSEITIGKPSMNTSYSVGGRSGHSVLEFSIQQVGRYTLACDYSENAKGPEVVVAVGSGVGGAISRTVGEGFVTFFGGNGAGLAVVLFVIVRRERAKKKLRQSVQAQV
jgi:hypothetical protein